MPLGPGSLVAAIAELNGGPRPYDDCPPAAAIGHGAAGCKLRGPSMASLLGTQTVHIAKRRGKFELGTEPIFGPAIVHSHPGRSGDADATATAISDSCRSLRPFRRTRRPATTSAVMPMPAVVDFR